MAVGSSARPADSLPRRAAVASMKEAAKWVERPLEPVITKGRGMHFMGFAPAGGFQTTPIAKPAASSSSAAPAEKGTATGGPAPAAPGPCGTVRGPSHWKRGRPVFEHGNYSEYYGYRLARPEHLEDPRLIALKGRFGDDVFLEKEVLDIGCNAGLVSLAVSRSFGARRVVGIDIDANLVDAARSSQEALARSDGACKGTVEFRAEDILQSPLRRPPDMKPEKFDVVLCFSMTKWVHFAHGDQGIHNLFKRIVKRLRPGGLLVLEPQEWDSYKKKRHLTKKIRQTVSEIKIPPEAFKDCLVGMGLEAAGKIKPKGDVIKGFQRPIRLFRKPAVRQETVEDCSVP